MHWNEENCKNLLDTNIHHKKIISHISSVVPNFFGAFLPFLILKLLIPPLWNFLSSPVRVRSLLLTTIGTIVYIDDNNLINISGTKTIYWQKMALKFVNKNVWQFTK